MKNAKISNDKILIIDLAKRFGGAEVRVQDTATLLAQRGVPYAVAVLNDSPLHRRLDAAGLTALPVPYLRSDPRTAIFLARAIRRGEFSVVDAHNVQSQFWGFWATKITRVPMVATVHSAYRLEHGGSRKGMAYEAVLKLLNTTDTRFIAVSEAVETYLRNTGIPATKIALIHNSLRPPAESPADPPDFRRQLGWGDDAWIMAVVARLEPVKGIAHLLDALATVRDTHPRLRLLIIGDGRERTALETQTQALGLTEIVHFAGFRNDVATILPQCNAFCLPSLSEGLPYALLEAAAQKLPLLVSAVGGMATLLEDRRTATFAPPADSTALADGLRWLMDNPARAAELGTAAYRLVNEKFNPDDMIRRVLAVYRGSDELRVTNSE